MLFNLCFFLLLSFCSDLGSEFLYCTVLCSLSLSRTFELAGGNVGFVISRQLLDPD